jgi:transcriptional regulator with PAS, ATPase and Fis domain
MNIQDIKQRFGIIGSSALLERAIDIAKQVAPTDLSVFITGENGTGKEVFSQIIHQLSARKHGTFIAVNCGAIPEGTIDSELFGHEKGSFTGANDARKGYFEVADGGTIFLDEVAEMPLQTQARLLRVLETGEFIRVGASKALKTNVRVVAATNVNMTDAIAKNKFREDLFYRLSSVPIFIPALRERKHDIYLLFRKFAADCAAKYRMPVVKLLDDAVGLLENYRFPGNIRQLKNIAEQISVIEERREINASTLRLYIPDDNNSNLPITGAQAKVDNEITDREILYKLLFDMKRDMNDLKKLVVKLMQQGVSPDFINSHGNEINKLYTEVQAEEGAFTLHSNAPSNTNNGTTNFNAPILNAQPTDYGNETQHYHTPVVMVEESLSLYDKEKEMIIKALERHKSKRKGAAKELGISERTLYRKINEYEINL